MKEIHKLERSLEPLRITLKQHPLYHSLNSLEDVSTFMEQHVYAVWDFMSLLKALQQQLSCVSLPWLPPKNPTLSRFINEIVLGEESDIDLNGNAISHYKMYTDAMREVGASTQGINTFLEAIESGTPIQDVIEKAPLIPAVKNFLNFTFKTIASGQPHLVAAAFTFGREDLIPDMFIEIVGKAAKKNEQTYPQFMYYLNRHIEIDGGEHGPLSLRMVSELCGENPLKWSEATAVATEALEVRIALWDAINEKINAILVV
jgi:hypothetical protein